MSKFETIEASDLEHFSSDFEQAAKLEKQGKEMLIEAEALRKNIHRKLREKYKITDKASVDLVTGKITWDSDAPPSV